MEYMSRKTKAVLYGKMYGKSIPTPEKLRIVNEMSKIIVLSYTAGKNDGVSGQSRLEMLEDITRIQYDKPGVFQDWLVDSVKKAYVCGFKEGGVKK